MAGFGIGLLSGALIGGVIALLYAPASGKETRAAIKEKASGVAGGIKDKATNIYGEIKHKASGIIHPVKDSTSV